VDRAHVPQNAVVAAGIEAVAEKGAEDAYTVLACRGAAELTVVTNSVAVTQALGDVWRGPGRLNTALGEV